MDYESAKAHKRQLEQRVSELSSRLQNYPKGDMGLTPDYVKALPEFQRDKRAHDKAFEDLQRFNTWFIRNYGKRYRREVKEKRAQ